MTIGYFNNVDEIIKELDRLKNENVDYHYYVDFTKNEIYYDIDDYRLEV
jgi:hypothetical protein